MNEINQYHSMIFNPYIQSINKVTILNLQYPKIQIQKRLLNILQNLLLIFSFLQFCIIIYLINQYDIYLRLRSPLNDLPNYTATRIPWIPEQYKLKNQMNIIWWSICMIYMPLMIIFYCLYFIHYNYWRKVIHNWLYQLHSFYLLNLNESSNKISQISSLKTHHLLDDGENSFLIIDIIQNMFECCGIDKGYMDWISNHMKRSYLHTYQNLMRNVNDSHEANYPIEIITNTSVPFSCYKRIKYSLGRNNILLTNRNNISLVSGNELFHNKGCVEPILYFLTSKWMKLQMLCLLIIILTMIPQMIVMLANIQMEELWKELKTLVNTIINTTKNGIVKFIEITKTGISRLKRFFLVHNFNIKNYEGYFEKLLESDETFYSKQLTRHELGAVNQEIELIETTLQKSPSILDQNSYQEQHQQQSQQIKRSTRPGQKRNYYQLTNQQQEQQRQQQKHRQYSVEYASHENSIIFTNLNRIPVNKLHKSYVHIRSNGKLDKVNSHLNERPIWKYTYKV
ncbi:uncharacterized protein DC041_0002098 [Schistosoma bovis]|uniref:Uncharacterized protein n=1 Tax=Schistosoma bovis TaxID=6184 RepID=A0A430QSD4_SCHBO|nr:uncharacterized protein DC041_0002098 [Schistosoma bovis]